MSTTCFILRVLSPSQQKPAGVKPQAGNIARDAPRFRSEPNSAAPRWRARAGRPSTIDQMHDGLGRPTHLQDSPNQQSNTQPSVPRSTHSQCPHQHPKPATTKAIKPDKKPPPPHHPQPPSLSPRAPAPRVSNRSSPKPWRAPSARTRTPTSPPASRRPRSMSPRV